MYPIRPSRRAPLFPCSKPVLSFIKIHPYELLYVTAEKCLAFFPPNSRQKRPPHHAFTLRPQAFGAIGRFIFLPDADGKVALHRPHGSKRTGETFPLCAGFPRRAAPPSGSALANPSGSATIPLENRSKKPPWRDQIAKNQQARGIVSFSARGNPALPVVSRLDSPGESE